MRLTVFAVLIVFILGCKYEQDKSNVINYHTVFEESKGQKTATYQETIDFYIELAKDFPEVNIQMIGKTDSGHPLHIVTFNPAGDFNFQNIRKDKTLILINNGIHPGESDGIDASMLLFRDLVTHKIEHPKNVVLVSIPIYNIGGALNRNSTTRANQNGPESYGFRGNAQNYDLNRDFIKADSKNAKTFAQIFHLVKPDIFVDTHVSNGADYQYTLTHLFTQHNKLGGELGNYLQHVIIPKLEQGLEAAKWPITPYVNVFNRPPNGGFSQFMDYPRYSTGYTSLWNVMGMMVETHMLKPYKQRVEGTYELLKQMTQIAEKEHTTIKTLREKVNDTTKEALTYHLNWKIDSTKTQIISFRGYEADTIQSEITGFQRLKYNRTQPFIKDVVYYNTYVPNDTIVVPAAYIIKKGWHAIVERLEQNQIEYKLLEQDTTLQVESYKIASYDTRKSPYEGHYLHYNTSVEAATKNVAFDKGDYLVTTDQVGIRYLIETLEPAATDSFFNWNFFDPILQQKEGFSPYVFEDVALDLLTKNQTLCDSFLLKKENDKAFSNNWYTQLSWIYKKSRYYEPAHLQYPVYRVLKNSNSSKILELD
jgi:hypothetical protein